MIKLIVDANILVGELLRYRGRAMLQNSYLQLHATERVLQETRYEIGRRVDGRVAQGRLDEAGREALLELARSIIAAEIEPVSASSYALLEAEARDRIPRDPDDWPTVAAALALPAAIWTQDYDFFGCGCAIWTTETLLIQLSRL